MVHVKPVAGLQVNVAAPLAFNIMLSPLQTLGVPGVTDTGNEAAVETTSVTGAPGQPATVVGVTVYVVVDAGVAVTVVPVEALNEPEGAHVYRVPPAVELAVKFTLPPGHIVGDIGAMVIVGVGLTVTTTVWVEAEGQPAADFPLNV